MIFKYIRLMPVHHNLLFHICIIGAVSKRDSITHSFIHSIEMTPEQGSNSSGRKIQVKVNSLEFLIPISFFPPP